MKASELIAKLQEIIATDGDLEVEIPFYEWVEFHPIDHITTHRYINWDERTIRLKSSETTND